METTTRRKFQGVINILSFNRHFYVIGLSILALVFGVWIIFKLPDLLFWVIAIAFLYGLLMPLIVSAYVYDFSGYYNFKWLDKFNISDSKEKHFIIKSKWPKSYLKVFDFYNAERHTEPAIIRARKVSLVYPDTEQIKSNIIPLEDKSVDIIFLLSAAHEIRLHNEKVAFLKECRRVCKQNGKIIMVEHLRDFPNFLNGLEKSI